MKTTLTLAVVSVPRINRVLLLGLLLIAPVGCARGATSARPAASANTISHTGQIMVTGTEGSLTTSLFIEGRPAVGLVGPLGTELRNLSGARVTVEGTTTTGGPGEALEVMRYEVIDINGQKPYVGIVVRTGNGHGIDVGGRVIRLERLPAGLIDREGAKVWLTGVLSPDRLQVQAYGVIRAN